MLASHACDPGSIPGLCTFCPPTLMSQEDHNDQAEQAPAVSPQFKYELILGKLQILSYVYAESGTN